jgi:hypothetical protein
VKCWANGTIDTGSLRARRSAKIIEYNYTATVVRWQSDSLTGPRMALSADKVIVTFDRLKLYATSNWSGMQKYCFVVFCDSSVSKLRVEAKWQINIQMQRYTLRTDSEEDLNSKNSIFGHTADGTMDWKLIYRLLKKTGTPKVSYKIPEELPL